MTFFFDQHFAVRLARALREAGVDCVHASELGEEYRADEQWLPRVGMEGWVVITQDRNILHTKAEREALVAAQVIAFFVDKDVLRSQDAIQQLAWFARLHPIILAKAVSSAPGTCYRINLGGKIRPVE